MILNEVVLVSNRRFGIHSQEEILRAMLHSGGFEYVVLDVIVKILAAGDFDNAAEHHIAYAAVLPVGAWRKARGLVVQNREIGLHVIEAPHVRVILICVVIAQA